MLKSGDGAVGIGEGSLEMGEHLGRGSVFVGGLWRRAASGQCGADVALGMAEAFPDAQQGPLVEMALEAAEGGTDAVGDDLLEESPESAGGQAEASDLVGEEDAEGLAAAGACIAIAAKDAAGAAGPPLGMAFVKTVEKAMANEVADGFAVGARGQFELFGEGVPFVVVAVKPRLVAHAASSEKRRLYRNGEARGSGVREVASKRGAG